MKSHLIGVFLSVLLFLSGVVFGAYGTLGQVSIHAPSEIASNQPVQLNATIETIASGWGTCTVRDVRAVLILPQGIVLQSSNLTYIGDIVNGGSADASWTIVLLENVTYTVKVLVTGQDSNGVAEDSSATATISAIVGSNPYWPVEVLLLLFTSVGIAAVLIGVAVWRWTKHSESKKSLSRSKSLAFYVDQDT